MTNQEIYDLVARFDTSGLQKLKLSQGDFKIELEKAAPAPAAAPAPEQPPFAMPGDKVKKGQTVCLIEAMKTMIEVPAPCDCVIEEVLKANGELAAFGEALMRYRPC